MHEITFTTDLGSHLAGTTLRVLRVNENPAPGTIDRAKAESLVTRHKVAVWGGKPVAPLATSKKNKKGVGTDG